MYWPLTEKLGFDHIEELKHEHHGFTLMRR